MSKESNRWLEKWKADGEASDTLTKLIRGEKVEATSQEIALLQTMAEKKAELLYFYLDGGVVLSGPDGKLIEEDVDRTGIFLLLREREFIQKTRESRGGDLRFASTHIYDQYGMTESGRQQVKKNMSQTN